MSGLATGGRAGAAALAGVLALGLTACGSSSPAPQHKSSSNSSASSTAAAAGGSTPDATADAAIRTAYEKFFAPDTPEDVSLGLLQDGQAFKATIEQQAKGSMASQSSVKVSSVTMQSADVAKVVFTIYLNGSAALPNQPGYAVKIDGTWKVAGQTFCALLTLENSAPPACKTPQATALPTS